MSLTPEQMVTIKNLVSNMSEDQLQDIIKNANTLLDCRAERRRKELWGNVVAAIQKYVSEIGDIEVEDANGGGVLCHDSLDLPGTIYVAY